MAAKAKKSQYHDVVIIGGGLAGLTMTALLASHGIDAICIDREPPPATLTTTFDGRTTAISWGSRKVLEAAGIWKMIGDQGCPINTIHILDGDSPLLLSFDSKEVNNRTFGWIVENLALRQALYKRVSSLKDATHIAPTAVSGGRGSGTVAAATEPRTHGSGRRPAPTTRSRA